MKNQIPNIISYPFDAQSSPFFCALASVLLPVLGYTEEQPFFCGPKDSHCINCGDCGGKTTLQKHHLRLYHNYQTFTGVGLGWEWPENDSEYHVMPGWKNGWNWPDEFFEFIFGFAGLSWKRLSNDVGRDKVFEALKISINAGFPVLVRFGTDWRVVTGYDDAEIIGLGYKLGQAAIIPEWFDTFEDAVFITGHTEQSVTYSEILDRMIQTLAHPAHAILETDLMTKLDGVTPENTQETVEWLLGKVGFPIEARWHAADSELYILCENKAAKDKIFGMIRHYVFDSELDATHGTCWKIWAQLGVVPQTNYALPPNAGALLLKPETQAKLKHLFAIVFDNDRVVLKLLCKAAQIIKGNCDK